MCDTRSTSESDRVWSFARDRSSGDNKLWGRHDGMSEDSQGSGVMERNKVLHDFVEST